MTDQPLSPAAHEVLTAAICDGPELKYRIAAALRAAADQVVPEPNDTDKALLSLAAIRNHCKVRDRFLAIAAELRAK
jgi:hypothetical protein